MGTESSQILRPNYWFRQKICDHEKIKVVDGMENPKTKTELRRILGFLTFFREHIEGFAEIAKPLTDDIKESSRKNSMGTKASNGV